MNTTGRWLSLFTVTPGLVYDRAEQLDAVFEGVIVVHPAAAMRLCSSFVVGVFENANRSQAGEAPRFEAKALHLYDLGA